MLFANADAGIITQWTFEGSVPATAGPHAAEVGVGSASGVHASTATYSNPAGNGTSESFSSNNWAVGDYYQFSTSTIGFEDIVLTFAQTSSGTGPLDFKLAYQVDGGGFIDVAPYIVLPNSTTAPGVGNWNSTTEISGYNFSFDLSSITALNGASAVDFRLINTTTADATPPGTVASTGTNRVDTVTVSGGVVPEPATAYLALGACLAGIVAMRRHLG